MSELHSTKFEETVNLLNEFSQAHQEDSVAESLAYDLKNLALKQEEDFDLESFTKLVGDIEKAAEAFTNDLKKPNAELFKFVLNGGAEKNYVIAMKAIREGKTRFEDMNIRSTIERLNRVGGYCRELRNELSSL
jgi:hypothetical protein